MFLAILFFLLSCICLQRPSKTVIHKLKCDANPYEFYSTQNIIGTVVTSENVRSLAEFIRCRNIPRVYVYGWENHCDVYVLYISGSVCKYQKGLNDCDYALAQVPCPCPIYTAETSNRPTYRCPPPRPAVHCPPPRPAVHCPPPKPVVHCPPPQPIVHCPPPQPIVHCPEPQPIVYCPEPQPLYPCAPPQPVNPCPQPKPVMKCPFFVEKHIKKCKNSKREVCRNPSKPLFFKKATSGIKKFVFKKTSKCDYLLSVYSNESSNEVQKYIINKQMCKSDGRTNIPKILYNPECIKNIIRKLSHKIGKSICLYVNKCSDLYVVYCDRLYQIVCISQHGKRFRLKKVSRGRAKKIAKCGLYNVEFVC